MGDVQPRAWGVACPSVWLTSMKELLEDHKTYLDLKSLLQHQLLTRLAGLVPGVKLSGQVRPLELVTGKVFHALTTQVGLVENVNQFLGQGRGDDDLRPLFDYYLFAGLLN